MVKLEAVLGIATLALWIYCLVDVVGSPGRPAAASRPAPAYPEYGRAASASPESDEEVLRRCRERAEEQRRRGRPDDDGRADPSVS